MGMGPGMGLGVLECGRWQMADGDMGHGEIKGGWRPERSVGRQRFDLRRVEAVEDQVGVRRAERRRGGEALSGALAPRAARGAVTSQTSIQIDAKWDVGVEVQVESEWKREMPWAATRRVTKAGVGGQKGTRMWKFSFRHRKIGFLEEQTRENERQTQPLFPRPTAPAVLQANGFSL